MADDNTEQIRARIAATRANLMGGIEDLASQVNPKAVKENVKESVKQSAEDSKIAAKKTVSYAASGVKDFFVDDLGVKWNNVGTVLLSAGGLAAGLGALSAVSRLWK